MTKESLLLGVEIWVWSFYLVRCRRRCFRADRNQSSSHITKEMPQWRSGRREQSSD